MKSYRYSIGLVLFIAIVLIIATYTEAGRRVYGKQMSDNVTITSVTTTFDVTGLLTAKNAVIPVDGTLTIGSNIITATIAGYIKNLTSDAQTQISSKEPAITAGTTGQYWRGDKTFQTLDKTAVGLSNVANTAQVTQVNATSPITSDNSTTPTIGIIQTSIDHLSSSLTTGLLKITTGTGALSTASSGSDYAAPATTLAGYGITNGVTNTTTVNGHALSSNVTVSADDVLPTQTGNSGKYVTTNGTTSSWGTVSAGTSTLAALTDVASDNATTKMTGTVGNLNGKYGEGLLYNGYNWINNPLGRRNLVINGDMRISQRPFLSGTTYTITNAKNYTADRWFAYQLNSSPSTYTVDRSTTTPPQGFPYTLKVQRTNGQTGVNPLVLAQAFETFDSLPFQGQTMTLSYYVKGGASAIANQPNIVSSVVVSTAATYGTDESSANMVTAVPSSGGGNWSSTLLSQTTAMTTSWQRVVQTVAIPATTVQLGIRFSWTPSSTSSTTDFYEITGVQFELGGVATPFEFRQMQSELAMAQRYYEILQPTNEQYLYYSYCAFNAEIRYFSFMVTKRVVPTAATFGTWIIGGVVNTQPVVRPDLNVNGFSIDAGTSSAGTGLVRGCGSACYMTFDAEI